MHPSCIHHPIASTVFRRAFDRPFGVSPIPPPPADMIGTTRAVLRLLNDDECKDRRGLRAGGVFALLGLFGDDSVER